MPRNVLIDDEELERLEEYGGLEAETVKTRDTNYMWFVKYVESEGFEFVELFASEDGREKFCDVFSRFFFSLRVNCRDDGKEKMPKKAYAEKIKSNIKNKIIEEYKVDISDPILFPNLPTSGRRLLLNLLRRKEQQLIIMKKLIQLQWRQYS